MASRIRTMLTKLFGTSEYRILVIGLDASGKTSILYKLKLNEIVQTIPTIGFNVETIVYKNNNLTIWDIGQGCSKIYPLLRHYLQNTQALIFVVDSRDKDRLTEATDELWHILSEHELIQIPLLIYLNKIDIPNGLKQDDIIQTMKLNDIRNRQWFLQLCSAHTGDGLYEGLDWLIRATKSPRISHSEHINNDLSISIENNNVENKFLQWLSQVDDDTNEEFIEKFENHQLSIETFDHRILLRIIWTYLKIYGRKKETIKTLFDHLRFYIKDINETFIYFWIQIVHYACEVTKNPTNDFSGFLLMNPQLLNETELPLTYYKKDTLFSSQAKTTIVLPDIKQLPSILPSSTPMNKRVEITNNLIDEELDDDEFLRQFESCTLTSWSHKTHLRMAWIYLIRNGRRLGVNKIFDGIKNFIQNSQIARKTTFHFTMTYFWIQMIDLAIAQSPKDINFQEFIRLNPHLLNGSLFLEYYKKETMLNNPIARQEMILPDIKPLPTLITSNKKK